MFSEKMAFEWYLETKEGINLGDMWERILQTLSILLQGCQRPVIQ
jgi:hypothetical protein